jgi:excisionase family DNA binding protein
MTEYLSVTQFSNLNKIDPGQVRRLIYAGRIPAEKIGNQWVIRKDTPPPEDRRVKSGEYKDWRKKYKPRQK